MLNGSYRRLTINLMDFDKNFINRQITRTIKTQIYLSIISLDLNYFIQIVNVWLNNKNLLYQEYICVYIK